MADVSSKLIQGGVQQELSLADPGLPSAGSDVLLRFPCGNTVRVHSLTLRLASPLIAEKLRSATLVPEGEASCVIVVDLDTELALFQHLLKFLYPITPRPQLTVHEAARLYPLCHKYSFSGVVDVCRQVLEGPDVPGLLGKSNPIDSPRTWVTACQWLELARGYSLPGLEAQCTKYIHSWSTAKIIIPPDEQLLDTIDWWLRKAYDGVHGSLGSSYSSYLDKKEALRHVVSLAERIKQVVTDRLGAAERAPRLPLLMLGGAELELLRGLSKDTLAAVIQIAVAFPSKMTLTDTRPAVLDVLLGVPSFIHRLASNVGMIRLQAASAKMPSGTQPPCQPEPVLPTTGADVLLRFPCGATQPAHSLILHLASPLLAEQLASAGCTAGEGDDVVLELDTDAAMFRRLLQFLYPVSPRPQLTVYEAAHLYPLCCKYNCVGLMEECRQVVEGPEMAFLLGSSSPLDSPRTWVRACQWLELARGYTLPGLEAQCTEYLHSWSTAKVIPDEQLVSALEGIRMDAFKWSARQVSWVEKDDANSTMHTLAESIMQLVVKREAGRVLILPHLPLGEEELQQLRGLSKDTLVAVIQAALAQAKVPTASRQGPLKALLGA